MTEAVREIPLSRPWLDEREEELVLEVLRSGRLSLGPWIDQFEEQIAERVGAPYAAALSSGTAGLHLLCRIAGLGPGDEVITSPLSFVSSANCFILEGATPVFADVDPVTLNLDPAAVEAAITERTRAHRRGRHVRAIPCELDELRAIADRHGLTLIEDACESLGAEYRGRPLGAHGPCRGVRVLPEQADGDRRRRSRRRRTRRRSGSCCAACATRDVRTTEAAAGSTTSASA